MASDYTPGLPRRPPEPGTGTGNAAPPAPPLPPPANNPTNKRGVFARFVSQPFTAYGSRPVSAQTGRDGSRTAAYSDRLTGYVSSLLSHGWPGFRLVLSPYGGEDVLIPFAPTASVTEKAC